jgi:hypothetical protein
VGIFDFGIAKYSAFLNRCGVFADKIGLTLARSNAVRIAGPVKHRIAFDIAEHPALWIWVSRSRHACVHSPGRMRRHRRERESPRSDSLVAQHL